jgi:RHS repeat-associated protein
MGNSCPAANYTVTYAREFRYDTGRARYMNRELDPAGFTQNQTIIIPKKTTWSDYDGNALYGDFTVADGFITPKNAFMPGQWRSTDGQSEYVHNDHLGSLRNTSTTPNGQSPPARVFTAFGERVMGPFDRHGYAGAWGYQSHEEFPYLHVGMRYYDPASGRFLQRDPIGVAGGLNVYLYCGGNPVAFLDPAGLQVHGPGGPPPMADAARDGARLGMGSQ